MGIVEIVVAEFCVFSWGGGGGGAVNSPICIFLWGFYSMSLFVPLEIIACGDDWLWQTRRLLKWVTTFELGQRLMAMGLAEGWGWQAPLPPPPPPPNTHTHLSLNGDQSSLRYCKQLQHVAMACDRSTVVMVTKTQRIGEFGRRVLLTL